MNYLKIHQGKKSTRFKATVKKTLAKKIQERRSKNNKKFFDKYGEELKELIIENEEQF